MKYICHVCGCDMLDEAPYDEVGNGTWEMCPCCGFESGMFCETPKSMRVFSKARKIWIENGAQWTSPYILAPENWDYRSQLQNLTMIGVWYEDV